MTNLVQDFGQISKKGLWILAEPSEFMKVYLEEIMGMQLDYKSFNLRLSSEVLKSYSPQKYILRGNELIVVTLASNWYAGIVAYDIGSVLLRESEGQLVIRLPIDFSKEIVSIKLSEKTMEVARIRRITEGILASSLFWKTFYQKGYISPFEFRRFYNQPQHWVGMPTARVEEYYCAMRSE